MKFKKGDRVRLLNARGCIPKGREGVVVRYLGFHYETNLAVSWDDYTTGHNNSHSNYIGGFSGYPENSQWNVSGEEVSSVENNFTKDDLKTGMVVQLASGNRYLVVKDTITNQPSSYGNDFILGQGGFMGLKEYTEDLMRPNYPEFDIEKVFKVTARRMHKLLDPKHNFSQYDEILWERTKKKEATKPAPTKLTVAEIAAKLGYDVEVVEG